MPRGARPRAPGSGDEWLRVGYLKAFMDGTLGSRTARLLDGSGVQITSGEAFEAIVRRAARAGFPVAVHAIGDPRHPRGARRLRGGARRVGASRAAPADRARAATRAGGRGALRGPRDHGVRPVQPRALGPRRRRSHPGRLCHRPPPTPTARCSMPATPVSTVRRARSRSSTRWRGCAPACTRTLDDRPPWHPEQRVPRSRPRCAPRPPSRPRGWPATSTAAAGCCRACSPTSSCSTAIRSTALSRSSARSRWWPRCSAAAGCTIPPPWD